MSIFTKMLHVLTKRALPAASFCKKIVILIHFCSSWLIKNMGEAEKRLAVSEPIRQDIVSLQAWLVEELGLTQLTWQRGLGTTHLRGCLQGLRSLMMHHQEVKHILKGKDVVTDCFKRKVCVGKMHKGNVRYASSSHVYEKTGRLLWLLSWR